MTNISFKSMYVLIGVEIDYLGGLPKIFQLQIRLSLKFRNGWCLYVNICKLALHHLKLFEMSLLYISV